MPTNKPLKSVNHDLEDYELAARLQARLQASAKKTITGKIPTIAIKDVFHLALIHLESDMDANEE